MTTTGSSSKRASSQPPAADPGHGPTWMQRQASSPGAAHQIDSGLTQSTAGEAYPVLYTKGAKEAVTIAQDVSWSGLVSQAKARVPSLPRAPRACSHAMDGRGMRRRTVWTSDPIMKPHRCRIGLGEGSPPMFNLANYTVAIAGRPVQATPDDRLVMSHRPCAGDQNSIKLVACSRFFLVALAASDV